MTLRGEPLYIGKFTPESAMFGLRRFLRLPSAPLLEQEPIANALYRRYAVQQQKAGALSRKK